MKRLVEISDEAYVRLLQGKNVVGTIAFNRGTGELTFKSFGPSRRKKDLLLVLTESGWMKESKTKLKFFSSVDKRLGLFKVADTMNRDLQCAVNELVCITVDENDLP